MDGMDKLPLGILLLLLHSAFADEQVTKKATPTLLAWYDGIIAATAEKLKLQTEYRVKEAIHLYEAQYALILHEVFPRTGN